MKNPREELARLKYELGIEEFVYCSPEEQEEFKKLRKENKPLPEGVKIDAVNNFYRYETRLTPEEIKELLLYRQTKYLRIIKNCVLYFTILSIVALILTILAL